METLMHVAEVVGAVTGIATFVCLLVKPIRVRILGQRASDEGFKCLLRSDMLSTYYRHRDAKEWRQYEWENFEFQYRAYKARGGNSFIDKIYKEVQTWTVNT